MSDTEGSGKSWRITSPGPTSQGTVVVDPDGKEMGPLRSVEFRASVGEVNVIRMELIGRRVELLGGRPEFWLMDPYSGVDRAVSRVEFADGSGFEVIDGVPVVFHKE